MKLRIPFILLILGCCLSSCDYYFDLEGLDRDSKLYVQCIAGNSDRTFINIQKAMGVNSSGDIMPDVESISLKVNGRECAIEKFVLPDPPENPYYGVTKTSVAPPLPWELEEYYTLKRYNIWYTDAPIKDSDELSLEVKAKGMESVSASARVPQKVVIQDVKVTPKVTTVTDFDVSYKESYLSFDVSIADVSPEEYYGVRIPIEVNNTYTYDDGRVESYNYSAHAGIINRTGSGVLDEVQNATGDWSPSLYNNYFIDSFGRRNLYIIPGSRIKDGHLQFDCNGYFSSQGISETRDIDPETGEWIIGHVSISTIGRYKVEVFRVSPEFYRFNKAQSMIEDNYLATVGLSPSTFSYTNIKGGFGVLGTLTGTSTPWYQAPAEPEQ
ncbi:MAG: DUF4249 family protein [Bacteroidales bacterium]|nr:DUF4249 family protein [Bacteroidales bacterium]